MTVPKAPSPNYRKKSRASSSWTSTSPAKAASGACGYLLKRTPREELIASLKLVQEGGSPMTSYIARKVVQSFHQTPAERLKIEGLSPREREVLELLAQGYSYKEIT